MEIRLIVPHTDSGNGWNHAQTIEAYGQDIAEIAGGFTAFSAIGGWIDGTTGRLIQEPVTVFDCTCADDRAGIQYKDIANQADSNAFRTLARRIARELRQECVYLRVGTQVEYVKPEDQDQSGRPTFGLNPWAPTAR